MGDASNNEAAEAVALPAVLYRYPAMWNIASHDPECLSIQALMKFTNYPFKPRDWEVPESSPSEELPFLRLPDNTLLVDEEIYAEIRLKASDLNRSLSEIQQAEHDAFLCLIQHKIKPALLYAFWCEPENFDMVTRPLHSRILTFPLNYVVPMRKRWRVSERLSSLRTLLDQDELYDEASQAITALAEGLGTQNYFFGDKPCELDAHLFGHLQVILHCTLPVNELRAFVNTYSNLVRFTERIAKDFFASSS